MDTGLGVGLMSANRVARTTPGLVALAKRLIAAGTPWREAAELLESKAAGDRESLQAAVLHWLPVMRRGPSDDFEAASVLRALERALVSTPRPRTTPNVSRR